MEIRTRRFDDFLDIVVETDSTTITETYHGDSATREAARMFLSVFTDICWPHSQTIYYQELAKTLNEVELEKIRSIILGDEEA